MSNNSVICIKSDNVNCEETSNTVNNVSLIDEELVTEDNIVNCETVNTVNNVPMGEVLTNNDIVNCEMRNTVNNVTSDTHIKPKSMLGTINRNETSNVFEHNHNPNFQWVYDLKNMDSMKGNKKIYVSVCIFIVQPTYL